MYVFHCVDICTDDANAMVGKTAGPFICIKEVAPPKNCILWRKKAVSLKNVQKYCLPLSTHFLIF